MKIVETTLSPDRHVSLVRFAAARLRHGARCRDCRRHYLLGRDRLRPVW